MPSNPKPMTPAGKFCALSWGLGNRLNGILNHIEPTGSVVFGWPIDPAHCGASWSDLFSTPLNVLPFNSRSFDKSWESLKFVYFYVREEGHEHALDFLRLLQPSDRVRERMIDIPPGTVGWHIRALSPHSNLARGEVLVDVPSGAFLACDSARQREYSKGVLHTKNPIGRGIDLQRDLDAMVSAVADWFCLRACAEIIHVGYPWSGAYNKPHTTFLDGHRLLGIPITCIPN